MRNLRLPALTRNLLKFACLLALPIFTGGWGMDGKMSTIHVDGPVARTQLDVFMVTLWVTGFIFICVASVLAYATIKFRARSSADEHAEPPPQGHGNPLVEISLIVASVLMLVIIAVPTLKAIWTTYDIPEMDQKDAVNIKATGNQWWFKFEYDEFKQKLPGGRIALRTKDVIHSFWLPKLAGKVDMIPNRGNHLWLKADKTGYYWGQCAEFCGESHGLMRFRAIVLSKEEFKKWTEREGELAHSPSSDAAASAPAENPDRPKVEFASVRGQTYASFDGDMFENWKELQQPAVHEDAALIAKGRQTFMQKGCISCHTVRGHEGVGIVGPELTHVASRTTIAAGVLDNTPENLKQWVLHPNVVKPGNHMYYGTLMPGYMRQGENGWETNFTVNETEADALVAYLHSLR